MFYSVICESNLLQYKHLGVYPINRIDRWGLSASDAEGAWEKTGKFQENYGTKEKPYPHAGEDWVYRVNGVNKTKGQPVPSPVAGTVKQIIMNRGKDDSKLGNLIRITTEDGGQYNGMHFEKGSSTLKEKDSVKKGDILGNAGNTGTVSTGPHYHSEIRYSKKPEDTEDSGMVQRYGHYYIDPPDLE